MSDATASSVAAPASDPASAEAKLSKDALSILLEEWKHCEAGIARYDTLQFQVRGWAISLVVALLAATVTLRQPNMALVGIVVSGLFWWIEALHDSYQGIIIRRVRALQRTLQAYTGGGSPLAPLTKPMIAECFSIAWKKPLWRRFGDTLSRAFYINVFVTYLSLIAVCLACYVIAPSAPTGAPHDIKIQN
jgi:hypothetical protein